MLKRFRYTLTDDKKWQMEDIELDKLNLIVGKNAVGKSRVLSLVSAFAGIITQKEPLYKGKWHFEFSDKESNHYDYLIDNRSHNLKESLKINNKSIVSRTNTTAKLFSYSTNKNVAINPPEDKLILHVRRDTVEYPYLEDIVNWAAGVHNFLFGHIHANFLFDNSKNVRNATSLEDTSIILKDFNSEQIQSVINDFNSLGYQISNLQIIEKNKNPILYVTDHDIRTDIAQKFLSQGMYRALALIVFCHHLINTGSASTITIDDLCEGLDYIRATSLGKLLFNLFDKSNMQLIVSSNDSFLMEVVDIKYWNVLKRYKNTVSVLNYKNCKDTFDDFKFTGLSKFDFFSSDYLEAKTCKK